MAAEKRDRPGRSPQLNVTVSEAMKERIHAALERAREVLGMPALTLTDLISASVTLYGEYLNQREASRAADVVALGTVDVEPVETRPVGRPRTAAAEPAHEEPLKRGRGRPRKAPPAE